MAIEDPFLTVEHLAELADTSAPYVRTVLSQAQLSLNQMRKDYARRLERRLGEERPSKERDIPRELTISRIAAMEISVLPVNWAGQDVVKASALLAKSGQVLYGELFTPHELRLLPKFGSLRELLPLRLDVLEQWAEAVPVSPQLAAVLGVSPRHQVLKLSTVLHQAQSPQAYEIRWLALDGLVLKWSKDELELKVSVTG